ncbi:MAG: flavin reductase family protein [Bacteroidia bacterium]|nr:MAG: flavin reductase family protein [Bacteroidia bacterium]
MEEFFEKIKVEDISDNVFSLIGKDWMLITAGNSEAYNMMTASWGTAGVLWRKPVIITFVRPQRYTYQFLEKHPYFSVSFFREEHREILNLCGTTSGRDLNKMQIAGLSAIETPNQTITFKEAKLTLECRKIYFDDIDPAFFQLFDLEKIYSNKDYHRFYIGEIIYAWKSKIN